MQNRYPGKCSTCSAHVPAETGTVRKVSGAWRTYCASHSSDEPAQERKLVLSGTTASITIPYDPEAVTLLRSLPGARWDSANQCWDASVATQPHASRVLDVAKQLALQVPDELEAIASAIPDFPRASTPGLYPFQTDGIRFLATHPRALLADDMGLGKTVQALLAIPDGAPVIVVAPACVAYNWRNETAKWRPDLTARVLKGKRFEAPKPGELVVVSWAALPGEVPTLAPETLLIADEAHFAKNYKSSRSKRLSAIAKACERSWLLTGTPLANRPTDLYSVLQVGQMTALGKWPTFVRLFNGQRGRWGGWDWGTPGPEVSERLKQCMLRRKKSEVLTDLPAKTIAQVVVSSSKNAARILDDLELDMDDLERGYLPPFEEMAIARRELAESRIDAAIEFCESFEESGEPIVVFSAHRAAVDTLGTRDGWACIHGDIPGEERTRIVERFQACELKGLAITIAAGGVGITLTRATNALFIDLAWNPADNLQAEDRIHRIGQKSAVTIHRMVSDHPIDRRVQELLEKKIALIAAALDAKVEYDSEAALERSKSSEERSKLARERAERAEIEEAKEWLAERESGIIARATQPVTIELTDKVRSWILDSMGTMVAQCDGAKTQDGVGFSKADAYVAHRLFRAGMATDGELRMAFAMLTRYPRQVGRFST